MNTKEMPSSLRAFITVSLLTSCDGVMETVVGVAGRTVSLPCRYDTATQGLTEVCWGMGRGPSPFACENTVVATNGVEVIYRRSGRHRLGGDLQRGDVSLNIYNAREDDSGFYHCRVELPGLFNDLTFLVYLIVRPAAVMRTVAPDFVPTAPEPTPANIDTPGSPFTPHYGRQAPPVTDSPGLLLPLTETSGSTIKSRKDRQGEPDPDIFPLSTTGPVMQLVRRTKRLMAPPSLESYIGHTIRVGLILFLPGLILTVLLRLRRSRNGRGGPASSPSPRSRDLLVEIPLSYHDADAWIYNAPTDI
ncbi:hepatitis A virus cellular receptor 1 homolog isoform X1 [Esox lucius]|nr:hepatitis A virus cellular receptor 1 homolog isoform X1 [Esox lucius]